MCVSPLKEVAEELEQIVLKAASALQNNGGKETANSVGSGRWTKKEILGHLIDSASNNHHRFVRGISGGASFPGYDQDAWVSTQKYNEIDWVELIEFWSVYNRHLAVLIGNMTPEDLAKGLEIEGNFYTLDYLANDYLVHLKHHLKQMVPGVEF